MSLKTKLVSVLSARPIVSSISLVLAGVLLGATTSLTYQSQIKDLESQLEVSRGEIDLVSAEKDDAVSQSRIDKDRIGDLESEVLSVTADIEELEDEVLLLIAKRPMPRFVGKDSDKASSEVRDYGWNVSIEKQVSDRPEGTVIDQSPAPGAQMKHGAQVTLIVAKKPPPGWKDVKVWSGSGSKVTEEVRIPDGKVRLVYQFSGSTNAIITMMERPAEWVDLYLNEIGNMSGHTRVYYSGKYYFEIKGGSWTVRLQEWR